MQIVKIESLINKYSPLKVVTALGEAVMKITPSVQSLQYAYNDNLPSFFADGNLPVSLLTFNKRGTNDAVYKNTEEGDCIYFPQTSYGSGYKFPLNTSITLIIEFDTLEFGSSRVLTIGTLSTAMITINATSTSLSVGTIKGSVSLTSAYNPAGKNTIAIIMNETTTKIICNGVVFEGTVGLFTAANDIFILNGAGFETSPSNGHRIYKLELYTGLNHTVDEVLRYIN